MSRIRTVKPELWRHEALSELPEATHMLAAALLNYADDEGYFNANVKLIQAECFPLREPSVSIHDSLTYLSNASYIRLGTGADGRRYGHIVNFLEHQRINRATPSKISGLDIVWDDSSTTHTQITEPSSPEWNGMEWKGSITRAMPAEADLTPDTPAEFFDPPGKAKRKKPDYPPEFEATWAVYPARAGGNSKLEAFGAWKARRRSAVSAEEIHAGVLRYAKFLQASGKVGTEYVKQAATFFGPAEHWREAWSGRPAEIAHERAVI